MTKVVHIDWETQSPIDPKKTSFDYLAKNCKADLCTWGVSPDFHTMPTEVHYWDARQFPTVPPELMAVMSDPTNWFVAFNSGFDEMVTRTVLGVHFPNNWLDSGIAASAIGYSVGSLKDLAKLMKCKHQKVELYPGLMKLFSGGELYGKAKSFKGRQLYTKGGEIDLDYYAELRTHYIDYGVTDTWVSAEIFVKSMTEYSEPFPIEDYLLHQQMNHRGLRVDVPFVDKMIKINAALKENSKQTLRDMCGVNYEVASHVGFAKWLTEQIPTWKGGSSGDAILPLAADREAQFGKDDLIAKACRLKVSALGTANAKFKKLRDTMNPDGALYNTIKFNGAAQTGRPSGSGIQLLNLARPYSPSGTEYPIKHSSDAHAAADLPVEEWIRRYGYEAADVAAKTIRAAFIPREGCSFVDADFSSIESVAITHMTQDPVGMDTLTRKLDAYIVDAAALTGMSYEEIVADKKAGGTIRQDHKPVSLGGGYGMSGPTLQKYAEGMGVFKPLAFWVRAIDTWRETHVGVVESWDKLQLLFAAITDSQAGTIIPLASELPNFPSVLERHSNAVVLRHPCGRGIWFKDAKMEWSTVPFINKETGEPDSFEAFSMSYLSNGGPKQWREGSYGGKLLAINTQSLCNSLLRDWMKNARDFGLDIVLQVYDQGLWEVPTADAPRAFQLVHQAIPGVRDPNHWSASWNVEIDGGILDRFWK